MAPNMMKRIEKMISHFFRWNISRNSFGSMSGRSGMIPSQLLKEPVDLAQIHAEKDRLPVEIIPLDTIGALANDIPGKMKGGPLRGRVSDPGRRIRCDDIFRDRIVGGPVGLVGTGEVPPPSFRELIGEGYGHIPSFCRPAATPGARA